MSPDSPSVAAACPIGERSPAPTSCISGVPSGPASSSMIRHFIASPAYNHQART
jgi:hypothetical protein